MIYASLSTLLLYALVSVLRARHRYLEWERFWCKERRALRELNLVTNRKAVRHDAL